MGSSAWTLTGNAGTSPASNYLGTTDAQPLVVKTNGVEQVRIDASGNVGIGTSAPAHPLHLPTGKMLRIEGGHATPIGLPGRPGVPDTANYFSFGAYGTFGIDAHGIPNGRFVVSALGNVGIGIADPAFALHLPAAKTVRIEGGNSQITTPQGKTIPDNGTYFSFGPFGTFGIDDVNVPNGRLAVMGGGNVGIGNPDPEYTLHLGAGKTLRIEGGTSSSDDTTCFSFGGYGTFGIDAPGVSNGRLVVLGNGYVGIGTPTPIFPLHVPAGKTVRIEGGVDLGDANTQFSFGPHGVFGIDAPEVPNGRFCVLNNGFIGIGNPSPNASLHLAAGFNLRIEGGTSANDGNTYFSYGGFGSFGIDAPGIANGRFCVLASGNVGIGTSNPTSKLTVTGDVSVGGDVLLTGADCAEDFDVAGEHPEPGTVVVIGEDGALHASWRAYDKRVAGVVSGAGAFRPGLILDKQASEGRAPVALVGKVYCKVDAGPAPIEVGDLLTTSSTRGHAMKAKDPEKAFACAIGKALRPLARGTGLIPILIALQ